MGAFEVFIYALLVVLTSIVWVPFLAVTGLGGAVAFQLAHMLTGSLALSCLSSAFFGVLEVHLLLKYVPPLVRRQPSVFKECWGIYLHFPLGCTLAPLSVQLLLPLLPASQLTAVFTFLAAAVVTGFMPWPVIGLCHMLGLPTKIPDRQQ